MDRLVLVNVDQLELHFRPSDRCSARFTVTNLMHTMSVAVHLAATGPYSLSPVSPRLLPPLSSATFVLTLAAQSDRPPVRTPHDSVLVRSAVVPTGKSDSAALRRLFSLPGVHVFRDATVPVFLVGPYVLDHLLLLPGTLTLEFARAVPSCSAADLSALLRRAAAAGKSRFVSELLSAGADADARGTDGRSALSLAVSSGDLASVDRLVSAGARVDLGLDRVFHESAAADRTDILAVLARSCASAPWADAHDSSGRTPVHYAAANGSLDAVRLCLESGRAGPEGADSVGWTPLHCAASGGFSDVVETLLDASRLDPKLTVTAAADGRKTAFDLAADGGHSHLYDALGLGDDLLRAAATGDMDRVRRCLLLGADVGRRDQNGWTALHRAAFKGRTKIVEFLIDNGAEPDAVDDVGFTPLRCAAEAGQTRAAMVLIDRGSRRSQGLKGMGSDLFSIKSTDNCGGGAADFVVPSFCLLDGL